MAFDREAAKAAGYTDQEIEEYLASRAPVPKQAPGIAQPQGPVIHQQPSTYLSGVVEPALTMLSGMAAEPISGLAGIAGLPFGKGPEFVEQTREALTFQPRTQEGREGLQSFGEFVQPLSNLLQKAQQTTGDIGYNMAGPMGGAIGETIPTALMMAAGTAPVRKVAKLPKVTQRVINKYLKDAAPTAENLKNAARGIYNELDDVGAIVGSKRIDSLGAGITKKVTREGIDQTLHPKATAALNRISQVQGKDLTLTELDTLRKIAKGAAASIDPADARMGAIMVEQIDDFLDGLNPKDFVKGGKAGVGEKFRDARQLYQRAKKSELLDEAVQKAQNQATGFENGIRTQFRSLLNNKKKMRGFTAEEKAAMKKVVQGTTAANMTKLIGKLGFSDDQAVRMLLPAGGMIAGGAAFGTEGAIAIPIIGQVSRKLSQTLTRNNSKLANAVIRAGKDGGKVVDAYLRSVPKNMRSVDELTELLMRPGISLPKLKMSIPKPTPAQKISADAVFFADFLRSQQEQDEQR